MQSLGSIQVWKCPLRPFLMHDISFLLFKTCNCSCNHTVWPHGGALTCTLKKANFPYCMLHSSSQMNKNLRINTLSINKL